MPARTLPTSPEPALSPPRFHPRPSLHAPQFIYPRGRTDRDDPDSVYAYNDRPPRPQQPPYALAMPAQLVRIDTSANATAVSSQAAPDQRVSHSGWSATPHRVYPDPATIPPHWQVHPSYRDTRPPVPPGTALQTNPTLPWARAAAYNSNGSVRMHPVQTFGAPPPPIPHKVWILDCKSCGMFLTNRGMKAVLLLRPNVPLYSTDALPINCSAFSAPTDPPPPDPPARPSPQHSANSSLSSSSSAEPPAPPAERPLSRTCECLTQTLCCHGCGNAVGYMIVAPCTRCTSSITANNRATNGHRFVFYSSEIVACKRHYVAGEPGVTPFHPPPQVTTVGPMIVTATTQGVQNAMGRLQIAPSPSTPPRSATQQQSGYSPSSPTSPSMPSLVSSPVAARTSRRTSVDHPPSVNTSDVVPTSPGSPGYLSPSALAARSRASSNSGPSPSTVVPDIGQIQDMPPVPPNSHTASPSVGGTPTFADPGPQGSPPTPGTVSVSRVRVASASAAHPLGFQAYMARAPVQLSLEPEPEPLRAGEVLYWHHLLRSGEIPAVLEDARARMDTDAQTAAEEGAKRIEAAARRRASVGTRRIVAGR
ncbi:hypothetical protein TRAPUB_8296 [Trametes pubescens]|uniref:Protein FAM72A n=1 Tax=Trametes pubescens TaxID=154538 RepID=A0A1M2W7X8_TRAPU|nr:hypothetical protein TRAPUB_8296 [Trametes pubescens]